MSHSPFRGALARLWLLVVMAGALVMLAGGGPGIADRAVLAQGAITPTPGRGLIPSGSGRAPVQTPMSLEGDGVGLVTVVITLEGMSGAEAFARAREANPNLGEDIARWVAQMQALRNRLAHRQIVTVLRNPPIEATVIGQTFMASNTIVVLVDVSRVPLIRALPGVRSVMISVPATLDGSPPPSSLDVEPPGTSDR